jgi:hypothetical protein
MVYLLVIINEGNKTTDVERNVSLTGKGIL